MRTFTVKEVAAKWNVTERQVTSLCKDGRIPGAYKEGRSWCIPESAEKPVDQRVTTGMYIKPQEVPLDLRKLPIGYSSFPRVVDEFYFVDKTLLIRDCIDLSSEIILFTRPRRFGKTLNMDMLRVFFEKGEEDTSRYFKDKLIWKEGPAYTRHQGQYPVIALTFKDAKFNEWATTMHDLQEVLAAEFSRHSELKDSEKCLPLDVAYYDNMVSRRFEEVFLPNALLVLSRMLYMHHGKPVVIIIDEYDTPIQQGYAEGFYKDAIAFMRVFLSKAFKDNEYLYRGFLTGVLRVAKESIFSGLNNLFVSSILDKQFDRYFGFTRSEVREICLSHNLTSLYDKICEWYDGYRFGDADIFNPWSIANFMNFHGEAKPYWVNTSSNDLVVELLERVGSDDHAELLSLLNRESIETPITDSIPYPQLVSDLESLFSFLLFTGYLKAEEIHQTSDDNYYCKVSIPNREVAMVFRREVLQRLDRQKVVRRALADKIYYGIHLGSAEALQESLSQYLRETASYHDTAGENFYHGLLLGLCAIFSADYDITSNRESGKGRYDIELCPRDPVLRGVLIEIKSDAGAKDLDALAEKALKQISEKEYFANMDARGVQKTICFGVAFRGKDVAVRSAVH